ncbi:peptidylprolyl isomerase [Clostridium sp. CX1]|uniref:Peptidylprolyl isomerase n=1 Tax=Clostridium tanneri TaxID=3037988 RepID=A0ABU4JYG1_9CLOT|nr:MULTISPECIES: peptidylprolyl isomerase [unclassified Clostridium]MCT8978878.1 peptidylprolyl isomerase [Clostridium sp. CX1]MDW8803216.1 peptidylprolyl isomerase [Clostridium sp. A1-XYC3]
MENNVLAIVNGLQITEKELEDTIKRFPRERQGYLQTEQGKKQLLDEIISFELIYNYAKDAGIEEDKEYIAQLEKAKKEILTQIAISKVMSEVKVTDEEIKSYYEANKHMFNNPEMVSAKHILIESEEKAEEIINKINNGMAFEDAAKEFSSCPSKAQGGSLGRFARGQMVPEFEEAAFTLELDELSKPVKTQFGYHIIRVDEKVPGSVQSFDEVKDMIKNNLLQQRQTYRYSQLNSELREKYNVEIMNQ